MKIRVTRIAPMVALMGLATSAHACDALVASTPEETVVTACWAANETVIPYTPPAPGPKAIADKVPETKTASKPKKIKKRCWYTNKRGQRRYRMRFSCS